MFVRCRRLMFDLALMGVVMLALSGCGQKGPLYLTDEMGQDPQPLEVSEQELRDIQDEEALQAQPYDGSLIPSTRR